MKQITLNQLNNGCFHINYDELMSIVKEVQNKLKTNSISQTDSQMIGIAISRMACGELVQDEIQFTNHLLKPLGFEVVMK